MDPMIDASEVRDDPDASRFVYDGAGQQAELVYRRRGDRLVLVHTEVPVALEGQGIGGRLVEAAVGYAAGHGLTVVPSCPFARSWLDRHPEVAARVPVDQPR
jgi:predicted GNAT family acetyltransferase